MMSFYLLWGLMLFYGNRTSALFFLSFFLKWYTHHEGGKTKASEIFKIFLSINNHLVIGPVLVAFSFIDKCH